MSAVVWLMFLLKAESPMKPMRRPVLRLVFCQFLLSSLVHGFDGLKLPPFSPDQISQKPTAARNTVSFFRAQLVSSGWAARQDAAQALIQAGDTPTLLRLVYALKQGYSEAERILLDNATIQVVPYLLEEVAHGTLQRSPDSTLETCGRVRLAATEIMARALVSTADLPEETKEWVKSLNGASGMPFFVLTEKSQALLEWWEHNHGAIAAIKFKEAVWLPEERALVPQVFQAWQKMNQAKAPPPPPEPPPPLPVPDPPLQVEESFEAWSARIVHLELRDLTHASVDYETGRSVFPVSSSKK